MNIPVARDKNTRLFNINKQILGIKINLDIAEQRVSQGIGKINELKARRDNLLYNLKLLNTPYIIVNLESYRKSKNEIKVLEQSIKQFLTIYNSTRSKRDTLKKQHNKAVSFRDKFVKENFAEAKVLIFKRNKNVEEFIERGDKKED